MMMMNFGMVFLMTMLMGGVSDVLDVIPSDEYWRIKNVQVSEASLLEELAPPPAAGDISKLVDDLGEGDAKVRDAAAAKIRAMGAGVIPQLQKATEADNPETAARARKLIADIQNGGKAQQVRKLMAIRTAGEKKLKGLLPRLTELTQSKEMFIADYAAAAVAAIEGKPYTRSAVANGDSAWKMPADVRAVMHLSIRGQRVATMDDLKNLPNFNMMFGNQKKDPEQVKQALDQMMRKIVEIADQAGNIRIEGVTMGLSGDIGNKVGYVVLMIDGQYDRVAVANLLASLSGGKGRAVGGIDVIDLEREFSLMFPSDRQLVLVGGPNEAPKPLEAIADAFKGNQSPLKQSPEMVKLLATVDMKQPVWGAMHVTNTYRQAPLFAGLDTLTLSGTNEANVMKFRFDASGNEAGVREAVGMVNNGIGQMKGMFQQLKQMPAEEMGGMKELMETGVKLVESLKVNIDATDAKKASMSGELDAPPQSLMATTFGIFFSARQVGGPQEQVAPPVVERAEAEAPRPVPPAPVPAPAPR